MGGTYLNQREILLIRLAGILAPIPLLGYGLCISAGLVPSTHYQGDLALYMITGTWMATGTAHFFYARYRAAQRAFVVIQHLLVGLYVILVSGIYTPVLSLYVLLLIGTYFYTGRIGFYMSASWVLAVSLFDFIYTTDPIARLNILIAMVALIFVSNLLLLVTRSQQVDQEQFAATRVSRNLERDRLITLINNLTDAIISTDVHGVVRIYNAAALNLLDTNANLNGKSIDTILRVQDKSGKSVPITKLLRASTKVVMRDDLVIPFPDDPMRLEVTLTPIRGSFSDSIRDPSSDGFILILRDITKAKSLEEERDEFISVVSHELRTPLSIAEGTISNLGFILSHGGMAPDRQQDSIKAAHEQIMFLSKMVNDLSTLSRAERGVGDALETIDVTALMNGLHTEYGTEAGQAGLTFNIDLGTRLGKITTSPLYLRELLQNLITNAIKYTHTGSITMRARRSGDQLDFAVIDTGIGISKSDQAKIFQKFYRSEDYRTRETRGTGLGLYVAAKLARKLGTRIELASQLNHGSTFSFTLTADPRETAASAPGQTLIIPQPPRPK